MCICKNEGKVTKLTDEEIKNIVDDDFIKFKNID